MLRRRAALALLVLSAIAVHAPAARMGVRAVRLRMQGYVGPPPGDRSEQADLTFRVDKEDVRFQVVEATVLSGGGLASDVFARVAPYKPNFNLRGPAELLSQIKNAPPGTRLVISGNWVVGSRDFLVGAVEPGSPTL